MCNYNQQFRYNHEIWAKYSFIELGFDMYRAKYEASIPKRPIKVRCGFWFIDIRLFKWQIVINKMTQEQVERMKLSFEWEARNKDDHFDNSHLSY